MKPDTRMLLLPGLLNDASLFQDQMTALSPVLRVEVADLTGSDSIAALAQGVLQAAPPEPFILLGLSMGGYVAFEIMRQAPERVCALALLDTTARPDTPAGTAARKELMQLAQTDFNAVLERLLPRLSHPERMNLPTVGGVIQSMATGLGKDVFIRQQQAIMNRQDSRPTLAQIRYPTLVVCGREDLITPPVLSEEIASDIRHAKLKIIKQCGHLSTLDQPEEVSNILLEWLKHIKC